MSPTLIVIGGPTAAGKTRAAVALAAHLGTEVISADSRQFYRDMRIGTARPAEEELQGVPHHFLGHLALEETWSAGHFAREVEPVLQSILARKGVAVMVGGSGLYIDAVIKGLDPLPAGDPRTREQLQERYRLSGLAPLLEELQHHDPDTWRSIDRANPHRVIRALEICLITGRPFSSQRSQPRDRTDIRTLRFAMDLPREQLYERIDRRVDHMVDAGMEQEARDLLPYRDLNALQTVGYREWFAHFDGQMDRTTTIAVIKQHTRNYAKRQLTWARRDGSWRWVAPDRTDLLFSAVDQAMGD
jgi:tRNA dimethylallyltransferase